MFHIDVEYLEYKIKSANTTREALASEIGKNRTTIWRHLKKGDLPIAWVYAIIKYLNLTKDEVERIFFAAGNA